MTTLRVLLRAVPDAGRADAWALFDDNQRVVRTGRSVPASWPEAGRRDAVLAASCVRIVSLPLPPMPPDRVAAAAAFALEDQLAGPADEQHIAVSTRQPDGTVEAVVANRKLVGSLAAEFDSVLAETSLAPRPSGRRWCWYASAAGGGFVRRQDGSAFAAGEPPGVPAELALALDHAARAGNGPAEVATAFAVDEAMRREVEPHGAAFVATGAWRWDTAGSAAFAAATDLRQGEFGHAAPDAGRGYAGRFRLAAVIAASALVLYVAASIGQWAVLRVEDWRATSALASLARETGATGDEPPASMIAKRYADARHRAGLSAPSDALPLLALAAPALAALPAGTLKNATYADGHWTFDFAGTDAALSARLERQLARAGLVTLQAATTSGTRMRVSMGAGAQ